MLQSTEIMTKTVDFCILYLLKTTEILSKALDLRRLHLIVPTYTMQGLFNTPCLFFCFIHSFFSCLTLYKSVFSLH